MIRLWPVLLSALLAAAPVGAQGNRQELLSELSLAYRILARTGVVDAYGHVTLRNPANPNHYFMQRNLPPALSTPADLVEYDLAADLGNDGFNFKFFAGCNTVLFAAGLDHCIHV